MKRLTAMLIMVGCLGVGAQETNITTASLTASAKQRVYEAILDNNPDKALKFSQVVVTLQSIGILEAYENVIHDFLPQLKTCGKLLKEVAASEGDQSQASHVISQWMTATNEIQAKDALDHFQAAVKADKLEAKKRREKEDEEINKLQDAIHNIPPNPNPVLK